MGASGYVYARNLVATRLYQCPVVYFEPYVMNNSEVFARIQAGDYEGTRLINGIERPSIYREYVDSVVKGLVEYYRRSAKVTFVAGGALTRRGPRARSGLKPRPLQRADRRFNIIHRHIRRHARGTDRGRDHETHFLMSEFLVESNRLQNLVPREICR